MITTRVSSSEPHVAVTVQTNTDSPFARLLTPVVGANGLLKFPPPETTVHVPEPCVMFSAEMIPLLASQTISVSSKMIAGEGDSNTSTSKVHIAIFPELSATVYSNVVIPVGKTEPELNPVKSV